MPKAAKSVSATRQHKHEKLLKLLSQQGAFARREDRMVRVYAPHSGVSLAVGKAPANALDSLVSAGAVTEHRSASGLHYRIADAGRLRLRREAAGGDGFAFQHADREVLSDHEDTVMIRNVAESPLLWLYRRGGGLIGEAEFAAGERLRADMTMARTLPRLTADLERPSRSGVAIGLDPSEARVAASQRVQSALAAVGPELSGVLMDVCGFLKGLDLIERERNWPQRSAKLVLALGLAALARHYGLSNVAVGAKGRRRSHRWTAVDARPAFAIDTATADDAAA